LFSVADNMRSIPSMLDGLKPGQRKVMWSAFKKKIADEVKVAQLVGYVSEQSAYHHGEASLTSTIVGLAQDFVGSNNINLLSPIGQFGTRAEVGLESYVDHFVKFQSIFLRVEMMLRRLVIFSLGSHQSQEPFFIQMMTTSCTIWMKMVI
jgi:DNA gyrase/topoisomerase IV, subunit A